MYYRYPLIEALKRIKSFGYDGVEIWGGRPHAYWEDMTEENIAKLKQGIRKTELNISNFIPAQFRYPTNLASTDPLIREGSVKYIKRNIEIAEKLEAPYISLCPGFSVYGDTVAEAFAAMLRSFEEIIKFSEKMNTKIILEPAHAMETDLVRTAEEGMRVVDYFGKDKMGLCLDTGHLYINKENLSDVVEKVKDYRVHWHFDDNHGLDDSHLVPGEGAIDFAIFLDKLKKTDYDGFLAVELGFSYTNDPDPAVRRSINFLNKEAFK